MKRLSILLALLLCLTGCSAPAEEAPEGFAIEINGCQIAIGAEAVPVIEALGKPKNYTEETSCAFEGLDKTYYYGSFYLTTCPMDGEDRICGFWFADDTAVTREGIRIGSTREEVERAYGSGAFDGENAWIVTRGDSRLTVILTEGKVSSVRFDLILD